MKEENKNQLYSWLMSISIHIFFFVIAIFITIDYRTEVPLNANHARFTLALNSLQSENDKEKEPTPVPQNITENVETDEKEEIEKIEEETEMEETEIVLQEQKEIEPVTKEKELDKNKNEEISPVEEETQEKNTPTETPPVNEDALLDSSLTNSKIALDMPGWEWETTPNKIDQTNETGEIIFQIKIDEEGEVISVRTLYHSTSLKVVEFYRHQVEQLTFIKKNHEPINSFTEGKITFVIAYK